MQLKSYLLFILIIFIQTPFLWGLKFNGFNTNSKLSNNLPHKIEIQVQTLNISTTNIPMQSNIFLFLKSLTNSTNIKSTEKSLSYNSFKMATTTEKSLYNCSKMIKKHEEKLETSLKCNLSALQPNNSIWKGNQTHELSLPIAKTSKCIQKSINIKKFTPENATEISLTNCREPATFIWEASIEIQSGDILLVKIDDSYLIQQETKTNELNTNRPSYNNNNVERKVNQLNVYQDTRNGYENCDITAAVLLDITALKVENEKFVTLYDKDLTIGMNLLIVTSELWGDKCVRLNVSLKSDNCGENQDCSGNGICFSNSSMDGYECQCCDEFIGQHCEERDLCFSNPCKNKGLCLPRNVPHKGTEYQCLCPYGYTGRTCNIQTNPCSLTPCENGGTCFTTNLTQFRCECPPGFAGRLCQRNRNICESSPCVHGICLGNTTSYTCICKRGFSGLRCEFENNKCEPPPCKNGGICRTTKKEGHFECDCTIGYAGLQCDTKINLCEPNPCPNPERKICIDNGDSYSCKCSEGFTGDDCLFKIRPDCTINPCLNGGSCTDYPNGFYCACKPGYTGNTCEDEFLVETISHGKIDLNQLKMPNSNHPDRLLNLYIAFGCLMGAVSLAVFIVVFSYCRTNKTYKRFISRNNPLLNYRKRKLGKKPKAKNNEWYAKKDKTSTIAPRQNLTSLDTGDTYFTLDFSESQSSPLIE